MTSCKLKSLDNEALQSVVVTISKQEKACCLEVVRHLVEVRERKLFATLGYASLFHYCAKCLGYEGGSAWRRATAAACVAKYPSLMCYLQVGRLTLTGLGVISKVILQGSFQDADQLIQEALGRSSRRKPPLRILHLPRVVSTTLTPPLAVFWLKNIKVNSSTSGEPCLRIASALGGRFELRPSALLR